MNDLQIFTYEETQVRTVTVDDEPWFVLADVCRVLDLSNPSKVAKELDDDEKQRLPFDPNQKLGLGHNGATIINESGLYTVIIRSNSPKAKPFRRWVTHEVLPSIRKTGSYTLPNYASIPEVVGFVAETMKKLKAEGKEPWEIAHACYELAENYGVSIPAFYVEDAPMTDQEWEMAVNFKYDHPKSTFEDFVITQCTVRQLRGRKPKKLES